jgi:hypothetical protein
MEVWNRLCCGEYSGIDNKEDEYVTHSIQNGRIWQKFLYRR